MMHHGWIDGWMDGWMEKVIEVGATPKTRFMG